MLGIQFLLSKSGDGHYFDIFDYSDDFDIFNIFNYFDISDYFDIFDISDYFDYIPWNWFLDQPDRQELDLCGSSRLSTIATCVALFWRTEPSQDDFDRH